MTAPLLRQSWTVSGVLINMFAQGVALSYPASLLPALRHPDSPIKVDLHTASWLGSVVGVSGIPGFLISSLLMYIYGRRLTHGLMILPGISCWLLIYFANDVTTLMIGRVLSGVSSAATVSLGAIVIGEYTSPEYRGVFLYLKNLAVCLGALFVHAGSRFLHWRTIAVLALIPLLVALIIIYTWPESPAWLVSKQKYEKSEEAFIWLRGESEASRKELQDTIKAQKDRMSKPKLKLSYSDMILYFLRKFRQKNFLKPLFIMILATLVLESSGRHVFPVYALQITAQITGENLQSYYYTLGIDMIITVSALFAAILVKFMNRRTMLFTTGFAAFGFLILVCTYLSLASRGVIPGDRPLVPISLLVLYFILANLGCAPVPLALVGEVFPLAHRGVGSALSGVWISTCLMIGLTSAPYLLATINVAGFFAVYGIIMAVCLLILYFIMPETKDRTLQEIENYINYGKYSNVEDDEEANDKMIKESRVEMS